MTQWESALVTGASSGIGAAMARRLAVAGTRRLQLVGRDAERLAAVARDLRDCTVESIVCDLADAHATAGLASRIAADPPDLLVNNAGAGHYGRFADIEFAQLAASLDTNVRALVHLTHAYCGARRTRGGDVLQVASAVAFIPLPFEAVYAATKAFVLSFSEGIAEEYRGTPMRIRCVCPGLVATDFARRAGLVRRVAPVRRAATPDDVARRALATFDRPGVTHTLGVGLQWGAFATRLVPRAVVTRLVAHWMRRGLLD